MIISEFGGGLGDLLYLLYNSTRYTALERLGPRERALVVLRCHNPFAKELFQWHPKLGQLEIRDVGFWWPGDDARKRAELDLPPEPPFFYEPQPRVRFYPSPEDLAVLEALKPFSYIVVSAAAGTADRNLPEALVEDGLGAILGKLGGRGGFRAVTIGRRYNLENRLEPNFAPREGLIDLVDRLSVPGTLELVARSAGVFACHSSVSLMAWYFEKPLFLAYPEHVRKRNFEGPPNHYTFGKDRPSTVHLEFSEYRRERFSRFLEVAEAYAKGRSPS